MQTNKAIFILEYCRFDRDRIGFSWSRSKIETKLEFPCSSVPILAKNFTHLGLQGKKKA